MSTFGSRLRAQRKHAGLTQDELGALVGIKKSAVAKYENNRIVNVSTDIAERFAKALKIPVYELLGTFEGNLYGLDVNIDFRGDTVAVKDTSTGRSMEYSLRDWNLLKDNNMLTAVWEDLETSMTDALMNPNSRLNQHATMYGGSTPPVRTSSFSENERRKASDTLIDTEGLSEDKHYLINRIMSLSDDEVRSLRTIVDQVLALREK